MSELQSFQLSRPLRLSLLWASMMFLYIYNDYFSRYLPGTIEGMMAGTIGPLGDATEGVLLGVAALMTIPALMVVLSAGLPSPFSKWLECRLWRILHMRQHRDILRLGAFLPIHSLH